MKFSLTILLIIVTTSCYSQQADQLAKVGWNRYSDGAITGRLFKFKHVFESNQNDLKNYKRFNRTRNTQRITNYSLVAGNLVLLGIIAAENCSNCTYDLSYQTALFATGGTAALALIANAIFEAIKIKRKKKLLNDFNGMVSKEELTSSDLEMNIIPSNHGIGISVTF